MKTMRIDGKTFRAMLANGLEELRSREEEINMLNVFPVADGDTGTNMRLTLEGGLEAAGQAPEFNIFMKALSTGMLYSARGNSGVILSQFFAGLYQELARCPTVSAAEMRNGFIRAYRIAYKAVRKPTEGTILTVTRLGIENIRSQVGRRTTIEDMLSMYVAEMKKTLTFTPDMLECLKEEGVVDSGAAGYICIIEGCLKYLNGEINKAGSHKLKTTQSYDLTSFNENSVFVDGYCMEFILQLMRTEGYLRNFRLNKFIEDLGGLGNSIVAVQDGKRVKVHIHTKTPAKVIAEAQAFGEFVTFKLENMQVMHGHRNTLKMKKNKHKAIATVAVVTGEGIRDAYEKLGCDSIIDCGPSMNVSSQNFVDEFKTLNCDTIVVLPNNKNTIGAAKQARELYLNETHEDVQIKVLNTKNMLEGYYALAMDVPDSETDQRLKGMQSGIDGVRCISQTTATKDYKDDRIEVNKGEKIILEGDRIIAKGDDLIKTLTDIDEFESAIVFRGADKTEDDEQKLREDSEENFPLADFVFEYGGQEIYDWIIGVI